MVVTFGQVVVGPPGSGKTTYCHGMHQYLKALGRDAAVINLDPANYGEGLPYEAELDIGDLVSLESVMAEFDLGPNGAMLYCLEYLDKNEDWLVEKLSKLRHKYLIFDFPGQVDLIEQLGPLPFNLDFFTECQDMRQLLLYMDTPPLVEGDEEEEEEEEEEEADEGMGEVVGEGMLGDGTGGLGQGSGGPKRGSSRLGELFFKMTEEICDVVDSYGLVSFHPLNIQDAETVGRVLAQIDKCNGFVLGVGQAERPGTVGMPSLKGGGTGVGVGGADGIDRLFHTAFSDTHEPMFERAGAIQERYMPGSYTEQCPPELAPERGKGGVGLDRVH